MDTNLKIGDEITVFIEKLVYEGHGLAKVDNFPIFVDGVCPNEEVKIKVTTVNKNYAKASLLELVTPSKARVKPICPIHNVCGGCQWQFLDYEEQLIQKRNIVEETVKRITGQDIEVKSIIKSPIIKNYRYKIQYPIQQTKVSKRILAGYYKKKTHDLINIKYCPINALEIDEITEFIRQKATEFGIIAYNENKHKGELRNIIFRKSYSKNEILITFVVNNKVLTKEIRNLANAVFKEYENVIGCCVNFNEKKGNSLLGENFELIVGRDFCEENLEGITYQINAGSFFQINPSSAINMFNTVKNIILEHTENPKVLDGYSGVASFGLWLKDIASEIYCVEEVEAANKNAKSNIEINKANNIKIFNGDAKKFFREFIEKNEKFDVVVLDPPRKGCEKESLECIKDLVGKYLIYVSCNPSTLARDLKYLNENGFQTKFIQPIDMFPHTYHIETITLLEKYL